MDREIQASLDTAMTAFEQFKARVDAKTKDLEERFDRIEVRTNRPGAGGDYRKPDEAEMKAFLAYVRGGREAMNLDEVKSLQVSDATMGGYLAPNAFLNEILRNLSQLSPVRSIARVMDISAPAALLPTRTGGMTGQWVGETSTRPETTVTFGQRAYTVREFACYVDCSNQMLEDTAFDIANELAFEFAEEFGEAEATAFVAGTGVLDPTGFLNDADVGYTAGGHATQITADGLIDLFHALKPAYRASGTWGMNGKTLAAVRKLKDGSTGQYLLVTGGIANAPETTLLGRPVVEMPDMPDVGSNAYPVVFGDFKNGYRIFDRVALAILRDPFSKATNGVTRFHGRRRVAGGVGKAEALRKLKIATS